MCLARSNLVLGIFIVSQGCCTVFKSPIFSNPEQIHISYGDNPAESIVVTWSTHKPTPLPQVFYGAMSLTERVSADTKKFVDRGSEKRVQYIHRARLTDLQPATKYVYVCGSELGWSEHFTFQTANDSTAWSPKIILYGDMGVTNNVALPKLKREVDNENVDTFIHVGDFAYNMEDNNGRVGDDFMQQIQPIAARIPYMVCPGNHERADNFTQFRERFSMPGNAEGLFYSYNLGPAHFISIDTEAYYYLEFGEMPLVNQWRWLINDLKEANLPENRSKRPWIIVYGHHPMYCSNAWIDDCSLKTTRTRIGLLNKTNIWYNYGLEEIFYNAGVDLEFWGHQHSYERLYPVYDYKVKKGSRKDPYVDPKGPVHITSGAAGSRYMTTSFSLFKPSWSAFRSVKYGYTKIQVHNNSHVNIQQIAVNKDREVIDDVWIIKNTPKPFGVHDGITIS